MAVWLADAAGVRFDFDDRHPSSWPTVPMDRVWVQPQRALHHIYTHKTPTARLASDHLPVVADITRQDTAGDASSPR